MENYIDNTKKTFKKTFPIKMKDNNRELKFYK